MSRSWDDIMYCRLLSAQDLFSACACGSTPLFGGGRYVVGYMDSRQLAAIGASTQRAKAHTGY